MIVHPQVEKDEIKNFLHALQNKTKNILNRANNYGFRAFLFNVIQKRSCKTYIYIMQNIHEVCFPVMYQSSK